MTLADPTEQVTIQVLPPKNAIKEGDNITLQCLGNGNPPPEEFMFYLPVSISWTWLLSFCLIVWLLTDINNRMHLGSLSEKKKVLFLGIQKERKHHLENVHWKLLSHQISGFFYFYFYFPSMFRDFRDKEGKEATTGNHNCRSSGYNHPNKT